MNNTGLSPTASLQKKKFPANVTSSGGTLQVVSDYGKSIEGVIGTQIGTKNR